MIMNYEGILEFKGTWRRYQARVLEHADRYMADGKIHIVAAPGSGKTTLGIELIRRMNGKALILAPSITIREQWIARIEEAFLCEGIQGEDYLSQNLKQPKAITVATYQALHSAMTRFQGTQEDAGTESGTGTRLFLSRGAPHLKSNFRTRLPVDQCPRQGRRLWLHERIYEERRYVFCVLPGSESLCNE